jgi:crotonobetainyl-CoA:carnitine CoA-transferase CaiB-like acyl-CoA transferase
MMLADLGAEVIKVESLDGDETRQWGPPWHGNGENRMSAYYLSVNRNKRSLTLNLKTTQGQVIAKELATNSHILVENFKVGQMAKFGLDFASLHLLNPKLVYCSITGYGQHGVYAHRAGYDYAIQAMSGLMAITGEADGQPIKVGVAIADVLAGLFACNAIQAALRHAEHTGVGQAIDMALLDSQIAALVNVASNYLVSGVEPLRFGNQHANIVPYQTFEAQDGDFVLACGNDKQFRQVCVLIGHCEWADDPRFATNPARVAHRTELITLLSAIFVTRRKDEWVEDLLALGVPSAPINSVATALNDPNLLQRGLRQTVMLQDEPLNMVASPMHLMTTPPTVRSAPPRLGEHTDEILRDVLGYDDVTIAQWRKDGVI